MKHQGQQLFIESRARPLPRPRVPCELARVWVGSEAWGGSLDLQPNPGVSLSLDQLLAHSRPRPFPANPQTWRRPQLQSRPHWPWPLRRLSGKKPPVAPTSRSTAWTASSGQAILAASLPGAPAPPHPDPALMSSGASSGTWRAATSPAPQSANVPPPLPALPLQPLMTTSSGQAQSRWAPRKVKTGACPAPTALSSGPVPLHVFGAPTSLCRAPLPASPMPSISSAPGFPFPATQGDGVVTGTVSLHRCISSAARGGGRPSEGAGGGRRSPEPARPDQ